MIRGTRSGNLGATLKTESHSFVSGLSRKLGGDDEGPDPHELLEGALAACTILTCQLYAQRKNWSLQSTEVSVAIDREEPSGAHLTRTVKFIGDLSNEQRERLLEIANKCPIHRLLSGKIEIETRLIEGS